MFKNKKLCIAIAAGVCFFCAGWAVPSAFAASSTDTEQARQLYKDAFNNYKSNNIIAAADGFMAATKLEKSNPLYALSAADMLYRLKQYQSAEEYYQKAIDNIRHSPKGTKDRIALQSSLGLARVYLALGDKEKAITTADDAVHQFPKKYNGYFLLGQIYADGHMDDSKAIENFTKALDADDTQIDVYAALVDLYKQKNDMENMAATLKKGCVARPLDENLKMTLGELYINWKGTDGKPHYREAEQVFKDLVGLNPKNAWGHYYLGVTYTMDFKDDEASNELALLSALNRNLASRLQNEIQQAKSERADTDVKGINPAPTITINKNS